MTRCIETRRSRHGCRSTARGGRALACIAIAGLAGCTLGPDYKRPELQLPSVWRAQAIEAADLANTDWWRALGDPDLDALIATALAANRDLQLATWRVAEFDARLQVSKSAGSPQVGYTALAERERFSEERPTGAGGVQTGVGPIINNFGIGGLLNWEIDLWGRVRRANEAALADLLASEDARRGVMLTVVSAVSTSYVQLLELDKQLALARQTLDNREKALALMESKYRGGSSTRLAVEQARAVVEAAQAEIPILERDIAKMEAALCTLLGRNVGHIQRRSIDLLALPKIPEGVPADLLTRRPDVMAAEQSLIAANARIGVAQTEYFPTLSLAAAIGLGTDNIRWLFAETARTGLLGAALTGPIFTGGRIEGDIRQAEAIQKQMTVRYEQAVQTAIQEVDDAIVSRNKSAEREAALRRQVKVLQEVGKLTRLRYEGGQTTLMEVLDADVAVFGAEGREVQSRRDTLLALVSVYKSMGGGWMVEQDKNRAPATPPAGDIQMRWATELKAQQ
jgi:outer membrane protein, multidrug efflux system